MVALFFCAENGYYTHKYICMKDDIYEYDEVKPPRFGPPARLSDDDTVADIVRELRFNKEFNDHLEE